MQSNMLEFRICFSTGSNLEIVKGMPEAEMMRQFVRARNKVCVKMRIEGVSQFQAQAFRSLHIFIHITLRVNDRGDASSF